MTTARLHPTPSDSARRSLWNCRLDLSLLGLAGLVRLGGLFGLIQGCILLFVAAWLIQFSGHLIPEETVEQTRLLRFFMDTNPFALLSGL